MARNWQDSIPAKIGSTKEWERNHPNKTTCTIVMIDELPGFNSKQKQLAIQVDVDDFWFRLNRPNCQRIAKLFGDNMDKWIGKKVSIERDNNNEIEEQFRSMLITPLKR